MFTVNPKRGTVPAFKDMDVKVTFRPIQKALKEDVLVMSVANGQGEERKLNVDGESSEGKVQFKKGPLDLSQFAVGIPIEKV